jgi:hypothetical protein
MLHDAWQARDGSQTVGFVAKGRRGNVVVRRPPSNLAVGSLQAFLDDWANGHAGVTMDYIHGSEVVERLSAEPDRVGFLLPPMPKSELFRTVLVDGALPRKTFSMGEADEKRFYLEARRIIRDST